MTPGFQNLPFKVSTVDGRNFVLLEPVTYVRKSGEVIIIPAGAESDGASTPRVFWNLTPPFGVYWPDAYLHDYLYRYAKRPRQECDEILLEAMELSNTPLAERELIYKAVRLGGESAFESDRNIQKPVTTTDVNWHTNTISPVSLN